MNTSGSLDAFSRRHELDSSFTPWKILCLPELTSRFKIYICPSSCLFIFGLSRVYEFLSFLAVSPILVKWCQNSEYVLKASVSLMMWTRLSRGFPSSTKSAVFTTLFKKGRSVKHMFMNIIVKVFWQQHKKTF